MLARLFPGWAVRRALARHALERANELSAGARNFDIADPRQAHRFRTLRGRGASGDLVMAQAGAKPRDWARYQDENSDLFIALLDTLVNQVAPVDPTPNVIDANGEPLGRVNDQIADLWEWVTESGQLDVSGQYPWSEQKRIVARGWLRDGEVFTRRLLGPIVDVNHPTTVPYSLLSMEPEFCPDWLNDEARNIVQGIELNRWGRPLFYHLFERHPGAALTSTAVKITSDAVPTPAESILHVKFARRQQVRGITVAHGVQTRLLDLKDYEESERIAAKIAASFAAVITRPHTFGFPQTNLSSGSQSRELEAGMIMDFAAPGETVTPVGTTRPSAEVTPFRAAMMRAVAGGAGASYSTIARDYSGNYSSQRQELVEAKPLYDRMRSYWIAQWLRPIYQDVVAMGVLAGEIDPAGLGFRELTRANYDGALMPWIDPEKEARADELAVDAGFKSRQQVIRERNNDPRRVDAELARDEFERAAPAATPTTSNVRRLQ